jgi:hypothetical protein
MPFGNIDKIAQRNAKGFVRFYREIWDNVSEPATSFVRSLLIIDPAQRPSAAQAL